MKNGANHTPAHPSERIELGQYIVADPEVCHGKPTFKGTRIMVGQVLDDVADGRSWEFICGTRWGGRISLAAVGEAVQLSRQSWLDKRGRLARAPSAKRHCFGLGGFLSVKLAETRAILRLKTKTLFRYCTKVARSPFSPRTKTFSAAHIAIRPTVWFGWMRRPMTPHTTRAASCGIRDLTPSPAGWE